MAHDENPSPPQLSAIRTALTKRLTPPVTIYERSARERAGTTFVLARVGEAKKLLIAGGDAVDQLDDSEMLLHDSENQQIMVCPTSPENAQTLRTIFPWTQPQPFGKRSALGCGDRLGVATPGHLRACRAASVRPILAQQSIREMERTGRSPQEVLDDATWAVFQEGYTDGFGADADHLKTLEHIDRCLQVGYTMYTIDPSDHVDREADQLDAAALDERFQALPWDDLHTTPDASLRRYVQQSPHAVEGTSGSLSIIFEEQPFKRAAVKYGAALAHTKRMADHLAQRYADDRPEEAYDLEMSVDETAHPTRPREHYFVAAELGRLDVEVTSLAPRFVGEFQKGIDFMGDLEAFEDTFEQHALIAEAQGGYKLSIHSGSDKFTVFPIMGQYAGEHLHLKTAGTSYLEALRIPARHAPAFFREIIRYAFERFEADRKTYHVTTDLEAIPDPEEVSPDQALEATYLEENNGRQLLHITYGSVLTAKQEDGHFRFKDRLLELLNEHETEHYEALRAHFTHHIERIRARV